MGNSKVAKQVASKELSFTADQVAELIKSGALRESYLMLTENFAGTFKLDRATPVPVTRKGVVYDMPRFTLSGAHGRTVLWSSTLLNALILPENSVIRTSPVKAANGLQVFFRDEFLKEHASLSVVSENRDAEDNILIYPEYEIIGALVTKSPIDTNRWTVGYRMYEHGASFLEFDKIEKGDANLTFIKEERILEISRRAPANRTLRRNNVDIILPSTGELKVVGDADANPRYASAQFIVRKNW